MPNCSASDLADSLQSAVLLLFRARTRLAAATRLGGTRKGSCDVIIDICSFRADDVVAVVALVRTNDLVFAPVEMCVASLHACVWEQGWRLLRAQRSGVRIPVR
jgi:hypothetical protein